MKQKNLWKISVRGWPIATTYQPSRYLRSEKMRDAVEKLGVRGHPAFVQCIKGPRLGEGYNAG